MTIITVCSMCSTEQNPKIGMIKCSRCGERICRECCVMEDDKKLCVKCAYHEN